jgi:hypothetical protein
MSGEKHLAPERMGAFWRWLGRWFISFFWFQEMLSRILDLEIPKVSEFTVAKSIRYDI